jgi:hypothetical protein
VRGTPKELRAVAIEYAWSKPHRLESVESVTIGRTRSTGHGLQAPDSTSRDHSLWTAVARKAALFEAAERQVAIEAPVATSLFGS